MARITLMMNVDEVAWVRRVRLVGGEWQAGAPVLHREPPYLVAGTVSWHFTVPDDGEVYCLLEVTYQGHAFEIELSATNVSDQRTLNYRTSPPGPNAHMRDVLITLPGDLHYCVYVRRHRAALEQLFRWRQLRLFQMGVKRMVGW